MVISVLQVRVSYALHEIYYANHASLGAILLLPVITTTAMPNKTKRNKQTKSQTARRQVPMPAGRRVAATPYRTTRSARR